MKKLLVLLLGLLLTTTLFSSARTDASLKKQIGSNSFAEYEYAVPFNTVYDIIIRSDSMVKATMVSVEDFDGYCYVYQFSVEEDYAGNAEKTINVYEADNKLFEKDGSYLLLLCRNETIFYPHPIYTSVYKEFLAKLSPEKLFVMDGEKLKTSEEAIIKEIKTALDGYREKNGPDYNSLISYSEDIAKDAEQADLIGKVRVYNEFPVNRYASSYHIEHLETLKGEGEVWNTQALAPELKSDAEYYIMLKIDPEFGEANFQFSKKYTCVAVDSEDGKALEEYLGIKN